MTQMRVKDHLGNIISDVPQTPFDELPPLEKRIRTYNNNIGQQLNLLYDDIKNGKFGEDAKQGKFYTYLQELKALYPV